MADFKQAVDLEKAAYTVEEDIHVVQPELSEDESISGKLAPGSQSPATPTGRFGRFLARLQYYEAYLDRKLGIEGRGPERISPQDRKPPSILMMTLLWASTTMNLSAFATGLIGYGLGLSFKVTVICIVFGCLLGAMVAAWCATLGPATGLRQISISRYSLGWWPAKLIAVLNVVSQCGWTAVGSITGGLALTAVSDGRVSSAVGIIIIVVVSAVFSACGLKAVLFYEKYSWIAFFIIFLVFYGEVGPKVDTWTPSSSTGTAFVGQVFTWLSIVYGSCASWAPVMSDYYVEYPEDTSKHLVFWLTTFGIAFFTSFAIITGACVASVLNYDATWRAANNQGIGYLIQDALYPRGFAKFVLVLLVLSAIGNGAVSTYSGGLSIQQFARPLQRVPRFIWTIIVFVVILLLSLAGRNHLLTFLSNFLPLLGYWCTAFVTIMFCEHYIFRRGDIRRYNLEDWNTPSRMPVGYAGIGAFALGIVGAVLGMNEEWYEGVLAKAGHGADIGAELSLAFSALSYPILRWLELRYSGR